MSDLCLLFWNWVVACLCMGMWWLISHFLDVFLSDFCFFVWWNNFRLSSRRVVATTVERYKWTNKIEFYELLLCDLIQFFDFFRLVWWTAQVLSVYYFLFLSPFLFRLKEKYFLLSRFISYYEFILNSWISCSPLLIHIHLYNLDSDILQGACEVFKNW